MATAAQLANAFAAATPGDLILLADGVYTGWFRIEKSGTASHPIVICGKRTAIDGGGIEQRGPPGVVLSASTHSQRGDCACNASGHCEVVWQ